MKLDWIASTLIGAAMMLPLSAHAQDYPAKPITMVVPFSPGGTTDTLGRIVADKLASIIGATIVVENMPGAGGVIGLNAVAHAEPDGYTIGLASPGSTSIAVAMGTQLPYDLKADLTYISPMAYYDNALVVTADFPVNSVKELVAYSKEHPGELTYGDTGVGSSTNLQAEMLKQATGLDMEHVAYKGGGEQIQALIGGHIKIGVIGLSAAVPFIEQKQIKVLAVLNSKRATALPDAPAVTEELPDHQPSMNWYGLVGPAGLPDAVVERLNKAMQEVVADADVKTKLSAQGIEVFGGTQAELVDLVDREVKSMTDVVKSAGIKAP